MLGKRDVCVPARMALYYSVELQAIELAVVVDALDASYHSLRDQGCNYLWQRLQETCHICRT
jgi:hypothetical protein